MKDIILELAIITVIMFFLLDMSFKFMDKMLMIH